MNNTLQEIANNLKKYDKVVLTGHEHPDGDSIGSCLALGLALKKLGKEVFIMDWGTSDKFCFLPGFDLLQAFRTGWKPDVVIFLDCSDELRIPQSLEDLNLASLPVFNIDHHISNKYFGLLNYVDPEAAATGEIVFNLIKMLGVEIDHALAICLYTAIATDTGSFRYSNTTCLTHTIAAELISKNLDVGHINTLLFEEMPIEAFRILQKALATFNISDDGKIAWITVGHETLTKLSCGSEHTDGLINYSRMIQGVEIGLLFKEIEGNLVKVGFRSKGLVDVNKLAQTFGGGGHAKAAGCKIKGTLEEVTMKVIKEAQNTIMYKD